MYYIKKIHFLKKYIFFNYFYGSRSGYPRVIEYRNGYPKSGYQETTNPDPNINFTVLGGGTLSFIWICPRPIALPFAQHPHLCLNDKPIWASPLISKRPTSWWSEQNRRWIVAGRHLREWIKSSQEASTKLHSLSSSNSRENMAASLPSPLPNWSLFSPISSLSFKASSFNNSLLRFFF